MTSGVIWDASSLAYEDIPTLGQLLELADKDILLDELLQVSESVRRFLPMRASEEEQKRKRKHQRKCYSKALKEMLEIREDARFPKVAADERIIIFPQYGYSTNSDFEIIIPRIHASAIALSEFDEVCARLRDDRSDIRFSSGMLAGRCYHWEPWCEVLNYRVWLAGNFSRCERYRVLADAVWTMTLFGFDSKDQEALSLADQAEIDEAEDEIFGNLGGHGWSDFPITHFSSASAQCLGLEASKDDYVEERNAWFYAQANKLKALADEDLANRIEHLKVVLVADAV